MNVHARLKAVKAIEDELQKCPIELRDLLVAARELTIRGAPASVTAPLWDRYRNGLSKSGKKREPLFTRSSLLGLVAAVDVIAKNRNGVDGVIAEVAKAAGVTPKALRHVAFAGSEGGSILGTPTNTLWSNLRK
jgi:hypothetical protein